MTRTSRRTAPARSRKATSRGPAGGGAKSTRSRDDLPARDIHTAASRGEVRAVNRRVTPSRQSNRRGRSAGGK